MAHHGTSWKALVLALLAALLVTAADSAAQSRRGAAREADRAAEKGQRSGAREAARSTRPAPTPPAEETPERPSGSEMEEGQQPNDEEGEVPEDKPGRPPAERYTFNSRFYAVTSDLPDKALAQDIAKHMDAVYAEYSARMSGFRANPNAAVKPGQRMPLYLIHRYKDYLALLEGFGFNARNSGGVFFRSPGGSGLATWVEGQSRLKMYYVLQHEGFHQFADARLSSNLPPWVNEGLAEYFGDALMVKGKLVPGRLDRERLERMIRAVEEGAALTFRELMTMDNRQWLARVTSGDKASSLMYDMSWSVCYSLIHGGKQYQAALAKYLDLLNRGIDGQRAFEQVFGQNPDLFENEWRKGLSRMKPDAWFSSVRQLQFMAKALKLFHDKGIEVKSFPHLKEQLARYKVRVEVRERDVVSRGARKVQVEHVEQNFDFPQPAVAELVPSTDPKLPHGLVVKGIKPTLKLSWRRNDAGVLEEDIQYDGK